MNFGVCLWALPENNHEWYNYTNNFLPHISIKTKLNLKQGIDFYNSINIDELNVEIYGDLVYSIENNFHALYFPVKILGNIPYWLPNNSHISFRYKYDNEFTESEISKIKNMIKVKNAKLTNLRLVDCREHYKTWYFIK
jgi:hypothetical protein